MGHPFLTSIIGRTDPSAVTRLRVIALKLRKKEIERDMERHDRARLDLARRYLNVIQQLDSAGDAS